MSERKPSCVTGVDSIRPQKVRLVEVCKVNTTTPPAYEGEKPYVSTGAVINSKIEDSQVEYWSYEERPSRANLFPSKGDILFAKMQGTRKTLLIDDLNFSALYSTGFYALSPQTDKIDVRFLFHYLDSEAFLSAKDRECKGATQKALNNAGLCKIRIPLPSLSLQQQIAARLDRVCEIVTKRRTQLVQLQQLVKSRFVEMFGSELEQRRWPMTTVGSVAKVCVGVVIKPTQYYQTKGVRAFRSLNIGEMCVKDSDWVFFSENGHSKNQKSVVHKDDVLVVRSGAPGTACVVPERFDGANAVDIIIARPDISKVDPTFLAMFTNMPHGRNQIKNQIGGAAQQHYNVGGYKSLNIIAPPLALQREFAAFVARVDKLAFAVRKSLETAEKLYRQQLSEAFS